MPVYLERYYKIKGTVYREAEIRKSEDGTLYHFHGIFRTKRQLEEISSSCGLVYNINGHLCSKKKLDEKLLISGDSVCLGGEIFTQRHLRELINLSPSVTPTTTPTTDTLNIGAIENTLNAIERRWDSNRETDDDNRSETTQTTFTTEGMDTPRARESEDEEDDDELVSKVIANLEAKMRAVKRHKKVAAEVERLQKLLTEKQADLTECEKIMTLEVRQITKE